MADEIKEITQDIETGAKDIGTFVQGIFSDGDGVPSSTRITMFLFSLFLMGAIGGIVWHMVHLVDPQILGLWLNAFPYIVTVLTGMMVAPYTVSRGAGSLSDLFSAMNGAKKNQ